MTRVVILRHIQQHGFPSDQATLTVQPLDPYGPYSVLKPPEAIAPGEVCSVYGSISRQYLATGTPPVISLPILLHLPEIAFKRCGV